MDHIAELIKSADKLCATMDEALRNEKKFCQDIAYEIERMNFETLRIRNDLVNIKERWL